MAKTIILSTVYQISLVDRNGMHLAWVTREWNDDELTYQISKFVGDAYQYDDLTAVERDKNECERVTKLRYKVVAFETIQMQRRVIVRPEIALEE